MRQLAVLALVIVIGFISVPGCSSAGYEPHLNSAPAGVSRTDPAIISLIEPTVSAADWPIVYDMLAELPAYARENVIITLADRTVSNRPEFIELNPRYAANTSGGMGFPTTPPCPHNDLGGCTGVFRKHSTGNNVGSYFAATVNLPCKSTHTSAAPEATGYLYSTHSVGGNISWEGGFNMGVTTGMGVPQQVVPYVTEAGQAEDQLASDGAPRLQCDQSNVIFQTWTLQNAANDTKPSAVLFVNGVFNVLPNDGTCLPGGLCSMTYVHPFTSNTAIWKQTCTTCTTSWTTSLAVSPPGGVNYTVQNTWFGVQDPALPSTASPTITWSGAVVGTFSSYGRQATPTTTAFPQASVVNDPASVPGLILIQNSAATGETVGINAHGNIAATIK